MALKIANSKLERTKLVYTKHIKYLEYKQEAYSIFISWLMRQSEAVAGRYALGKERVPAATPVQSNVTLFPTKSSLTRTTIAETPDYERPTSGIPAAATPNPVVITIEDTSDSEEFGQSVTENDDNDASRFMSYFHKFTTPGTPMMVAKTKKEEESSVSNGSCHGHSCVNNEDGFDPDRKTTGGCSSNNRKSQSRKRDRTRSPTTSPSPSSSSSNRKKQPRKCNHKIQPRKRNRSPTPPPPEPSSINSKSTKNAKKCVKKAACEICRAKFANHQLLLNHASTEHVKNKQKVTHVCKICNMCFSSRKSWKAHTDRHNSKKFKCHLCSKSFNSKRSCIRHQNEHKGKQFACLNCGKRFAQKPYMNTHYTNCVNKISSPPVPLQQQ